MPAVLEIPPNHFLPHPFGASSLPSSTSKPLLLDRAELSRLQGDLLRQPSSSRIASDMTRVGVAVASSLPHHYGGYSHPRSDVQIGVDGRKDVTAFNYNNTNSCSNNTWREDSTAQQTRPAQRQPVPLISQHSNINQETSSNSPVKSTASSVSSPQLGSSMSGNAGNLAEFAAQVCYRSLPINAITHLYVVTTVYLTHTDLSEILQVACLFWFAKASKLKQIEDSSSYTPTSPLELEFAPSPGFKKWVTTVLTTTQVSKNVILLALLFIYRLKKFNPAVRGKRGSEFRLMTIALMMGNKFLDDNTYTNKTWAEVSGISVQEIHVMEVEFLSNVRYNLFVTKEEWNQWLAKLSVFSSYFEKASRLSLDVYAANQSARASPVHSPLTPAMDNYRASQQTASQIYTTSSQAVSTSQNCLSLSIPQSNNASFGYDDSASHSAVPVEPLSAHRKRSWDDQANDNPAKRPATANTTWVRPSTQAPSQLYTASQLPSTAPPVQPQLPTSIVSMPSNMAPQLTRPQSGYSMGSTNPPTSLAPLTGTQPISTAPRPAVFPVNGTPTHWSQPPVSQPTLAPLPVTNLQQSAAGGFPDSSRRPGSTSFPATAPSTTISPAVPAYSVRTPTHLSPSSILLDRNSPYRPVRSVNTLLYPPPAGSLLQPRQLSVDLMRYQPLGKRSSEHRVDRTGVLPYSQPNIWGEQYFSQVQPTTHTAQYHQS
ncbi:Meiotically up-regulated protein [Trichophyton interdigitale]|uniref:Meiotically up-regulated gene protein n=1 Tax=Trichophyton interdigitale TaxID=101480 RepID=A0A9P4YHS6_9EURO|nr:Meiotically up-regulated protein [Trichophyton interdigitale]KAF3894881.1 Meiotically up-regulated protein [Trichophyton interdigitale]KAG8208557.1 Meiotically up-regulated protein [Trichophyton interdigitale]